MTETVCKDLILLAGRDKSPTFSGKNIKFLFKVGGIKIIEHILDQVEQSLIEKVIIIGSVAELACFIKGREKEYYLVEQGDSFSENILKGLDKQQQTGGHSRAVISVTDLPFLSKETLNWLASLGNESSSDTFLPIVSRKIMLALSEFYQTYYWPMTPESFKWGDAAAVHVDSVGGSLIKVADDYRKSGFNGNLKTVLKRIRLLFETGGMEAASILTLNYLSKLIQQNNSLKGVPFSKKFVRRDYERILSLVGGMEIKLVESPRVDLALDIDSEWRQSLFNKRYQQIRSIMLGEK